MIINGFIAVRLPHLNYLVPGRDVIPCLDGLYYAGMDRQRWVDLFDEDYYAKRTPQEIAPLASALYATTADFSGLALCQDAQLAWQLLDYCNRGSMNNELIAVRSQSLDGMKGAIETNVNVEWLGFDVFALGEWSLLKEGVFMYPQHYSAWVPRLNQFGLFDDSSWLEEFVSAYDEAVKAGRSEPLAPPESGSERISIKVGLVKKPTE
jgi:hypothetical protein